MKPLFRIKICGITRADDARSAVAAGADAIGLNFYSATPRYVAPEVALEIRQSLPADVCCVGVFVNQGADEVASIASRLNLGAIQLHGDEPEDYAADLRVNGGWLSSIPLIRAFRCRGDNYDELGAFAWNAGAAAALIDAYVEGKYGGAGEKLDWDRFREGRVHFHVHGTPLILAGGLNPQNIATAIATARPDAVDVASGVEQSPGKKDPELMRRFVENARDAFQRLDARREPG